MSEFYIYLESGKHILDPEFDSYNPGTQLMIEILDEQEVEFEDFDQYKALVESLEDCKTEDDIKDVMYGMGTDYVEEMEVQNDWMDIMFPRAEKSEHISYA